MLIDLRGYGWMLVEGLWVTLLVGLSALAVAIVLGLAAAAAKLSGRRWLQVLAGLYTTVIRGIPELLLLLIVFYGTPTLIQSLAARWGWDMVIDFDPFVAGVLTLGFIYGAFATEVFRGAFQAVPVGQIEAARACGMSSRLTLRRIVLPQVWRFALPGLGNVWLILIKATALVSVIQLDELMRKAYIAMGATKLPFNFFLVASFLYLGITVVSMALQYRLEVWSNRGVRRA